jgi:hypothetical protein
MWGLFAAFLAACAPCGTSPLGGGTREQSRCRCVAAIELRLQYGEIMFSLSFLSRFSMHDKNGIHFIIRALHGEVVLQMHLSRAIFFDM